MSRPLTKNKKIALLILGAMIVAAGIFGAGHGVFAAPDPAATQPSTAGNAINQIFGSTGWVWGAVLAIMVLVQKLFALGVAVSGIFLDTMFNATINLTPSLDATVQVGWTVLRDFVNGVFIMLVLWIALTIILGIEQFGGKKLLVKVLTVAVLINFSLAIVTAIVVLSNQFAHAFYDKIQGGVNKNIAGYIIGLTKIQTATNTLTSDQSKQLAASAKEAADKLNTTETTSFTNQLRDGMFASIGFHSTEAATEEEAATACFKQKQIICASDPKNPICKSGPELNDWFEKCKIKNGFDDRMAITKALDGVDTISDFFTAGQKKISDWSTTSFEEAGNAVIAVVLMAIVITAFMYAAVALGIRYFAIIFLAIASPIAFLTVALPLNLGKSKGWDYWWDEFMKWVFFAPAFYFLIYLTLIMANRMHNAFSVPPGLASIRNDPRLMLGLFVVMGLLIYASRLAKKTSGKMGEFTVGLAKKAAGLAVGVTAGVATGGTLLAARGLARRAVKPGTRTANVLQRATSAGVPGAGALQRVGLRRLDEQKKDIEERQKGHASFTTDDVLAQARGGLARGTESRNTAALLKTLVERPGGLSKMTEPEREQALKVLSRHNMGEAMTKVDPRLATEKLLSAKGKTEIGTYARAPGVDEKDKVTQYVAENLSGKEINDNLDVTTLKGDTDASKAAREGLIRNSNLTQSRIEQILQKDFQAAQEVVAAMPAFLTKITNQIEGAGGLDEQIRDATTAGDTTLVTKLNADRGKLQTQRNRIEGVKKYLTTTPGGQALGITPGGPGGWTPVTTTPPIAFTGNRVLTGRAGRFAVDLARSVTGGEGARTFSTTTPGFLVEPDGILKTDPAGVSLLPGIHPLTVTVTDAAGTTTSVNLTMNINP